MESNAPHGKIQISESTWALLKDNYSFEERDVNVKGRGMMKAYVFKDIGEVLASSIDHIFDRTETERSLKR
jgi:hypothetical protein